jgi:F-type H+-transporting ATPase subunit gamma
LIIYQIRNPKSEIQNRNMASLLDMRRRIKSVKNTQQITKAMKMVAAAKLKRAQDRVTAARPYAVKMGEVLSSLSSKVSGEFSHPLLDERGDERYLIILVTADKGLCGGFNANLVKATANFLRENAEKQAEMIPVGRKGRDFFRRRDIEFVEEYIGLTGQGQVKISDAREVSDKIIRTFVEDGEIDKVILVFTEFKTVLSQQVKIEQLLPIPKIEPAAGEGEKGGEAEYIYEQTPAEIFGKLLPKQVETQVYRAMLESVASEQGSRMTAMDSATKNAGELIDTLTLNMNRIRQAGITNEIIEVVSGAAAQ